MPVVLIEKYLTRTLEPGEAAAFRDWLNADRDNLRRFVLETYLNRGIYDILNSERIRTQLEQPSPGEGIFHALVESQQGAVSSAPEGDDLNPSLAGVADRRLRDLLRYTDSPDDRRRVIENYANRRLEAFMNEQKHLFDEPPSRRPHRIHFAIDWRLIFARVGSVVRCVYLATAAVAVLLVIGIFLVASIEKYLAPSTEKELAQQVVATLDASVEAEWTVPPQQAELRRGRLNLERGWAELRFRKGTKVVLQAPCVLDLLSSNSMFLASGNASARIESAQARGFTVHTPKAKIIDFGTEFGVQVDQQQSFELHVFDGSVKYGLLATGGRTQATRVLNEGQAAWTDGTGTLQTGNLANRPSVFDRTLPSHVPFGIPGKRLDLANVLAQGSGFGTSLDVNTIDPTTGQVTGKTLGRIRSNPHRYIPLVRHRFIDGVFVPDGQNGAVIVSTAGDVFEECPDTGGDVWTGVSSDRVIRHADGATYPLSLAPSMRGGLGRPMISMHANAGITFDLVALRNAMPNVRIAAFHATAGLSTRTPNDVEGIPALADIWVLADGKCLSRHIGMTKGSVAEIRVPLQSEHRFLTLATTDGGNTLHHDHCLFLGPSLELEPAR